jgi:arylsulfatase A-like enzyme
MPDNRPNFLFILSDDHAAHAISCYGSRINQTPHLDRIATGGMRLDNCFCTNSICTPSRATILTGTYNHVNGCTTLATKWDNRQTTYASLLREAGYQTALVGKWHLGIGPEHCPTGFDYWSVLPGQGLYHDPEFIEMGPDGGTRLKADGYVTDIITDRALDWLGRRDADRPFALMVHHKCPHRSWEPDDKHARMYDDVDIPEPASFHDDHSGHARAAREARMTIEYDLLERDVKGSPPADLTPEQRKSWLYQRYIKDYLRCVASMDDNIGRLIDYLQAEGLWENTVVVYTSDQGFFLGDHGWYDKRFMYEESLRMPFVISYPKLVRPGSVNGDIVLNVDFAQTFLDLAGVEAPDAMQGRSFRPLLRGQTPDDWRRSFYYRYWMHGDQPHNVCSHYGVRTLDHKLIYYYSDHCNQPGARGLPRPPEWELFDLNADPLELKSVYDDPAYADVAGELKTELRRLQLDCGDRPHASEESS